MPAVKDVGNGASITFATSTTYTAKAKSINYTGPSIDDLDTTDLSTTGTETAMLADVKKRASFSVTAYHDGSLLPPVGVSQTITITHPIPPGLTNGATIAGTGSVVSYNFTIERGTVMECSYEVKFLGAVTETAAS